MGWVIRGPDVESYLCYSTEIHSAAVKFLFLAASLVMVTGNY